MGFQIKKKGFKVRILSIQNSFLFLTIIASFTGTLFLKIPLGQIHLFPYRFLMLVMWFMFVINLISQSWRFNTSNIQVKVYLKFLGLWLCYAIFSLTCLMTTGFLAIPPIIMTLSVDTLTSSSIIFFAIILHKPAVTLATGMPLFSAWVQSLLQKTLHRPLT